MMRAKKNDMDRILTLEPRELGLKGGCHVAAKLLKLRFPKWEVVAFRDGDAVKHVALRRGGYAMDIRGISLLSELEKQYACSPVPISLEGHDFKGTGIYYDGDFMQNAEAKLAPYIEALQAEMTNKRPEANGGKASAFQSPSTVRRGSLVSDMDKDCRMKEPFSRSIERNNREFRK